MRHGKLSSRITCRPEFIFAVVVLAVLFISPNTPTQIASSTERSVMFPTYNVASSTESRILTAKTIWTTDLHAGPIGCQFELFWSLGLKVVAKVDFSNCAFFFNSDGRNVCAQTRNLKVLKYDGWRGFSLDPSPGLVRREFFNAYSTDAEFRTVDYVICSHPAANCELYLAFNKSIIIYNTQRIEFGRGDDYVWWRQPFLGNRTARWEHWVSNLKALAQSPMHLIAANNRYDVNHMLYHTGVTAKYIPSWCGGEVSLVQNHTYRPTRHEFVLTPYRLNLEFSPDSIPFRGWPSKSDINTFDHPLFSELHALTSEEIDVISMSTAFPGGKFRSFSEFGAFRGAVLIPYQSSTMFFFQLYRSCTPILAPSSELLMSWVKEYRILWEVSYGDPPSSRDENMKSYPNPNSFDAKSRKAWFQFYDIYQTDVFPHILYFDSWNDASKIVKNTNFAKVSDSMRQHNVKEFHRIREMWSSEFKRLDEARKTKWKRDLNGLDENLVENGFQSLSSVEKQLEGLS